MPVQILGRALSLFSKLRRDGVLRMRFRPVSEESNYKSQAPCHVHLKPTLRTKMQNVPLLADHFYQNHRNGIQALQIVYVTL